MSAFSQLNGMAFAETRHRVPLKKTNSRIVITSLLAIAWIAMVGAGLHSLFGYEHQPGSVGAVSISWPGKQLKPAPDRVTLVMVAHPRCPCTRASVAELAQVMAGGGGRIAAYVLFVIPKDGGPEWEDTALRREAAAIPGVTVVSDIDGAEAVRFGAETSGHTLLFAPDGRLLFSGGITESRGHSGGNAGEDSVLALINNQTPSLNRTLVFGCALRGGSETAVAETTR